MKILLIILALILAASAVTGIDLSLPEIDLSNIGSSVVIIEGEEVDLAGIYSVWHVNDHDNTCGIISQQCGCGIIRDNVDGLMFGSSENTSYSRYDAYVCDSCYQSLYVSYVHCFKDGVCHQCGFECRHQDDGGYFEQSYLNLLPEEHPFKLYEGKDWPYSGSGVENEYVVNGICLLCGMNV